MKTCIFSILKVTAVLFCCMGNARAHKTKQPDIDHKPAYGRPFAHVPAREDAVIYQVNMRAFSKEGNFAGVIARLDSIKALGANVIYLMPIYPLGVLHGVNSPYCIKDYTSINTEFGGLSELRTLVDGAHKRDMAVILDWVGNHTAWDHPWVAAHRDWYKQDSTGKIMPPTQEWKDVAQLNFSNAAMRATMINEMKDWVYTANVDGFRCDYADGPPADFWKQAIDELRGIPGHKLLFLAEGTRSENYAAGFDFNFGFRFFGNLEDIYGKGKSVLSIDTVNTEDIKGVTGDQQIVRYTTNHDVNGSDGTPIHLFGGKDGAMAAFAIAACMEGVPMIYNGQEVDMEKNIPFPFTSVKIDWSRNNYATEKFKKIIACRKGSEAIKHGKLQSYSNDNICVFTKVKGDETILVLSNVRNEANSYELPTALAGTEWKDAINGANVKLKKTIDIKPYSYMILKKK